MTTLAISLLAVHNAKLHLGTCHGWWSPIASAGPQSTLSGVLAGFVFTGIVVVLSTNPDPATDRPRYRSYALQLLAAAFFIFALDSYFTSITAGELACNRANAESLTSGGTLGTGALMLIAGLSWLLVTYSEKFSDLQSLLIAIVFGIWTVIIAMLTISGQDVGQALLYGRNQDVVNFMPYILAAIMVCAVTYRTRRLLAQAKAKTGLHELALESSVKKAALIALIAGVASGLFTGISAGASPRWWADPPPWSVYLLIFLSMLIPAIALIASVPAGIGAMSMSYDHAPPPPPNSSNDGSVQGQQPSPDSRGGSDGATSAEPTRPGEPAPESNEHIQTQVT
jgi:hypothetical protein